MSLLIPQAALDSLLCDCCHKYLSVTPITVFHNGRIKCGRCVSKDDKNGFISVYNKVAKRSSFKCINHYEGCKTLLNSSEVLQHEAACASKEYVCPVCTELIPSYFIYNHFTNKHKESVLKKPYFVVKRSNHTDLHFLYRYGNYLLFLKYSHEILPYDNLTEALINFSFIGDSKTVSNLSVDIVLTFGKTTIEKRVNCHVFPSGDSNDLKMNLDLAENNLMVGFSLEVPESDVTIQNVAVQEECLRLNDLLLSSYFKNRDIYLDPRLNEKLCGQGILRKHNEHNSNEKNSKIEVLAINQKRDIKLTCFMCSITNFRFINDEILFIKKFEKYHFICHFCEKTQNANVLDLYVGASYLGSVTYFCKWMCGSHVPYYDLHQHENDCKNQISQPCPEESCEHRCKSFEIGQHFKDKHSELPTPVFHYFDNYFLSHYTSLVIYYVVSNISIAIELTYLSHNNSLSYNFDINLTCKILNALPRMVILDHNDQFKVLIKEKGSVTLLRDTNIKYMCYLADPAKENLEIQEFNTLTIDQL